MIYWFQNRRRKDIKNLNNMEQLPNPPKQNYREQEDKFIGSESVRIDQDQDCYELIEQAGVQADHEYIKQETIEDQHHHKEFLKSFSGEVTMLSSAS